MPLRHAAGELTQIAEHVTWASRQRMIDGEKVIVLPLQEAEAMKAVLLRVSHLLNDAQDDQDRAAR